MQEAQSSDAGEGSETGSAEFNNDEVLGVDELKTAFTPEKLSRHVSHQIDVDESLAIDIVELREYLTDLRRILQKRAPRAYR